MWYYARPTIVFAQDASLNIQCSVCHWQVCSRTCLAGHRNRYICHNAACSYHQPVPLQPRLAFAELALDNISDTGATNGGSTTASACVKPEQRQSTTRANTAIPAATVATQQTTGGGRNSLNAAVWRDPLQIYLEVAANIAPTNDAPNADIARHTRTATANVVETTSPNGHVIFRDKVIREWRVVNGTLSCTIDGQPVNLPGYRVRITPDAAGIQAESESQLQRCQPGQFRV